MISEDVVSEDDHKPSNAASGLAVLAETPRCGTCARFVRAIPGVDRKGTARMVGECLLGVWPAPLYDNNTCERHVTKGTFTLSTKRKPGVRGERRVGSQSQHLVEEKDLALPQEIMDMDEAEFRNALRTVLREELALSDPPLLARFRGGEMILKPGKEGTQEKRVPLETFFTKVVAVRDKLRLIEQKVNASAKLDAAEKVQLQQYITQAYGSLTTFNVLFEERDDAFVGQKGE
jgi:hypothetical protein